MDFQLILPLLILLLFVPLFLSARKQRKQMNEMQRLQTALTEGDVVMTTSGLRGTVVDASYEETVDIEIAEGVVTTWVRAAVRQKVEDTAAGPAERAEERTEAGTPEAPAAPTDGKPSLTKDDPAGDPANGAARG